MWTLLPSEDKTSDPGCIHFSPYWTCPVELKTKSIIIRGYLYTTIYWRWPSPPSTFTLTFWTWRSRSYSNIQLGVPLFLFPFYGQNPQPLYFPGVFFCNCIVISFNPRCFEDDWFGRVQIIERQGQTCIDNCRLPFGRDNIRVGRYLEDVISERQYITFNNVWSLPVCKLVCARIFPCIRS